MCKLGELATYDHSKNILKKSLIKKNQQDYIYFVVDYQDLLLLYVSTPADVLKSRLMKKK